MNENAYILLEKLIKVLCILFIVYSLFNVFYVLIKYPENYMTAFFWIVSAEIIFMFLTHYFKFTRFSDVQVINSDIFEYNFKNTDELLKMMSIKCPERGLVYKHELTTNLDENFVLYTSDNNEFPKEKVGIYISDLYECEAQSDWSPDSHESSIVPGQGRFHFEYRPYLNMICGKTGRDYCAPRDWVNIETIIIVVVDEWNGMLNKMLNHGWHLPFVLFCVIVKSEPNKLFIAKDNRKKKRDDYYKKREELFSLLDVRNTVPIGEMKYTDCKEQFEFVPYEEFIKVIEERNKEGRYYT